MKPKFLAYYRISNAKSGGLDSLGIEWQKQKVSQYLNSLPEFELVQSFEEVISGKLSRRPELDACLKLAKAIGATIVTASMSRLSRNAAQILQLLDSGVPLVFADNLNASPLHLRILACFCQEERETISLRVKNALKMVKARGVKRIGNPNPDNALRLAVDARRRNAEAFADSLKPIICQIRDTGQITSYLGIAQVLNVRGFKTIQNKPFQAQTVKNLVQRLGI